MTDKLNKTITLLVEEINHVTDYGEVMRLENALADVLEILDVMLGTNLADDELGRARGDIENGAL